jgi:acetyl-CoA synthetase
MTATAPLTSDDKRAAYWRDARGLLSGLPDGKGLNIAHEAVDRHAAGPLGDQVAVRWLGKRGEHRDLSYRHLADESNRFANVLAGLGVLPGDTVFLLLGRVPDLYIAVLGALKARAIVCPLFSAFGPEPVRQRLTLGSARVLVTSRALYEKKVAPVRAEVPSLAHVLLVDDGEPVPGTMDLHPALERAEPTFTIAPTDPEAPALLHFTSGTTGTPKGVVHVHAAVTAQHVTGKQVLGFQIGDRFWCTADPGWVTGMSYGVISPLTNGVTMIVDQDEFDVDRWYTILESERVDIWYTAPTALRMLMRAGTDAAREHDLRTLRTVASVGEPLNPEVVLWGREAYGLDILDNWWQTETGGIMIANRPGMAVRPGSMGRPIPGIEAAILERDERGDIALVCGEPKIAPVGTEGELALRKGWPSMFRAYLGMGERYRSSFTDGWYRTGDLARVDGDGYYWFVGRADDVIKSAGHLIGPFEVESALMEHPAVAEAGVIGVPDPVVGALVKAFVVLKPGVDASDALLRDMLAFARRRLGAAVAPRDIEVRDQLPRTRSGKIMRRLLRARELGLPEGDLSTLEGLSTLEELSTPEGLSTPEKPTASESDTR